MGWDELDVDQIKLPGQEEPAPAEPEEVEEKEPIPEEKSVELVIQQKSAAPEKKVDCLH